MNRHIRFRVWNNLQKKFFKQDSSQRLDLSLEYWETHKRVEWPQQFTGLLDKNGNEIYEGDIIKSVSTGGVFEVKFGECLEGYIGWYVKSIHETEWPLGSDYRSNKNMNIEVIGNIHETPELLNS